ncbi:hypothetical protein EJ07DRAFT_89498, partial [Lizonia empirigonia]
TPAGVATFDSLRASRTPVFTSMDMLRVRWSPFGSIQSSVYVSDDLSKTTSSLSPYQQSAGGDAIFHQISTSPATDPPVSSITVQSMELEDWELMRCCGQDRPHPPAPLSVQSTEGEFVTVHDFVIQTHEWLQPLREDILNAMEV